MINWLLTIISAPSSYGQILKYAPSREGGVSFHVNVPEDTASAGSGPIFFQIKGPTSRKWIALGQGSRMISGNMFIVYSAPGGNVTLSPRRTTGPVQPAYHPDIDAYLLEGSGISDGMMTANVRCDNCMKLHDGTSIMSQQSEWIWATTHGEALDTTDVEYRIYQHDFHGIFSLDLTKAIGSNTENPFTDHEFSTHDYTSQSSQQQLNDTTLHKKRIAHGAMSSIAFVLLFPNFGLTLYLFPSRRTVAWIHGPLQMLAAALALCGLGVGVSVSKDVQGMSSYHPIIGYIAILGVALFQPVLGIIQHLRFRKHGQQTMFGLAHRYLARGLIILGVINGGLGFRYACTKTTDVPTASKYAYAFIVLGHGLIVVYVSWRRSKTAKKQLTSDSETQLGIEAETKAWKKEKLTSDSETQIFNDDSDAKTIRPSTSSSSEKDLHITKKPSQASIGSDLTLRGDG